MGEKKKGELGNHHRARVDSASRKVLHMSDMMFGFNKKYNSIALENVMSLRQSTFISF